MKYGGNKLGIMGIVSVLAVLTSVAVSGVLQSSRTITSHGTVMAIGVEVYWDEGGTNPVSDVDWGVIEPGGIVNRTVYVKNTGNSAMTLSLQGGDWSPEGAGSYLTVSWNRESHSLGAGQTVSAVLSLQVSSDISGIESFSFNMVIRGTG